MRILFTSLFSLIDPASGAAISVRTILRLLSEKGHDVSALSAGCFDNSQFDAAEDMLNWLGFKAAGPQGGWVFNDKTVTHVAYPQGTHKASQVNHEATRTMVGRLEDELDKRNPDVIITYGFTNYEQALRKVAKARGIPLVSYLAHPGYKSPAAFEEVDLVFTDSKATHDLYMERMNLVSTVIGKFIVRPNAGKPRQRSRQITFVNPSYQKGVTLFYRIAEIMNQTLPTARFFVVESRMTLAEVEAKSGLPFSQLRNIRSIGLQTDMAEVFARTSILLMPSLWHESGGRAAIEALSLGIPIVSSNHGGLPEHLGAGATRIDVPEQLQTKPHLIPPPSVALPWVSSLSKLWTDDQHWEEKSQDALQKWEDHEPSGRVQLIETCLNAVIR